MSDQRQHDDGGGPNAPGAGPPPPRLNPSPPKPRINLVAVVVVLGLVIGAGGLGVGAVKADQRRTLDAKEKMAAQKRSDARREDRAAGVSVWRDWADVTCQSVRDTSVTISEKLAAIQLGISDTQDARQLMVLLADAFTMISDLYRTWGDTMAAGPKPDQPDADAQVLLYIAYFRTIADQVQRYADSVRAVDPGTIAPQELKDLIDEGAAIDRTIAELPDAGDVYRGVDEAPVCQDVSERVETKV